LLTCSSRHLFCQWIIHSSFFRSPLRCARIMHTACTIRYASTSNITPSVSESARIAKWIPHLPFEWATRPCSAPSLPFPWNKHATWNVNGHGTWKGRGRRKNPLKKNRRQALDTATTGTFTHEDGRTEGLSAPPHRDVKVRARAWVRRRVRRYHAESVKILSYTARSFPPWEHSTAASRVHLFRFPEGLDWNDGQVTYFHHPNPSQSSTDCPWSRPHRDCTTKKEREGDIPGTTGEYPGRGHVGKSYPPPIPPLAGARSGLATAVQ
jgi:hypothetical protein